MALVGAADWIGAPEYNRLYIADTSFLIKSALMPEDPKNVNSVGDHALLKSLRAKLKTCGCKVIFNSVAKQELLRHLRKRLCIASISNREIDGRKLNTLFLNECSGLDLVNDFDRSMKTLLRKGYINFFEGALGVNGADLETLYNGVVANFSYISFGGRLDWSHPQQLMSEYGLDSSDAMIINAGVKTSDCVGLLTGDADYKYCYSISNSQGNGFDIILPDRLKGRSVAVDCFEL